jgi:hypothetical protein
MPVLTRLSRILVAYALCGGGHAWAADAHVHGQGRLDIAVDEGVLTLRLEAPLDSLVGFERAPHSAKERDAVRRLWQETLMDPSTPRGTRELLTDLDLAGLADIGWQVTAVPEPGSAHLLLAGLGVLGALRWQQRSRRAVSIRRRHPAQCA